MDPFDIVANWTNFDWIFDIAVAALEEAPTEIQALFDLPLVLFGYFVHILMAAAYPLIAFINMNITFINTIITSVVGFFNAMIDISMVFTNMIGVFEGVFPSQWTYLLGAIVTINIILRAYSLIPVVGKK